MLARATYVLQSPGGGSELWTAAHHLGFVKEPVAPAIAVEHVRSFTDKERCKSKGLLVE